ncbi:MAG: class I SAM-dependent methyltransferase [Lentisphaerae bacterium]|nr:class I SAM-dependent methyltransferase [Lentisphaerota bacterium]
MSKRRTKDPVNQANIAFAETRGAIAMGLLKSREWIEDPRRFLFSQSRYKFVSKMLSGRKHVLEIGCGDAYNSPIVMQEIKRLTVTDFDPEFIADAQARVQPEYPYVARVHNFLEGTLHDGPFDAAYSLDVLEHIDAKDERTFIGNICKCLTSDAAMIIGMPSLESQAYATPGSKAGHVNCKSAPVLKSLMESYFHSVFMFSMNDEVVHTGYHKMAHYILALCAHPTAAATR